MPWVPIPGLTGTANALYAENQSLIEWMEANVDIAPDEEVEQVVDMLIRVGKKIDALDNSGLRLSLLK
ncbi:hypothetical protein SEA_OCTOBIEN14_74 [Gordonia phage Octobien14]|uniref:Uncharacterized protein n=1 Tax=Gordonia phage Octobien14 TaxID=2483673 RepID=A0A3G3M9N9_9CAUD|nr:hypothetical protein L3Y22_gp074 [Gordonia phage Octobien14]AYR03220.1 hypothetical protein SEA_OCTOBIEN14_74 [Gordonia phage Octobien14]